MNKNQLILGIQEAFKDVPYPGDSNISYTHQYDYEDYEGYQMENFFRGKKWQNINANELHNEYPCDESACLVLMSPEAFYYYLPAYMIIGLEELEHNSVMADSAVYAIDINRRKIDYSIEQKKIISCFVEYVRQGDGY